MVGQIFTMSSSFVVKTLGPCTFPSPLVLSDVDQFVTEDERILENPHLETVEAVRANSQVHVNSFECAGPRAQIFFESSQVRAAIVTCGGLCPGLNTVVRSLVVQLWHRYSVRHIYGIMGGYHGLSRANEGNFWSLSPDIVEDIHLRGGTVLGTSRGTPPTDQIVDTLEHLKINHLYVVGGDGTMRGGEAISQEAQKRGLKIAVIGVPKTIDNDVPFVRRAFGFETAVQLAVDAVRAAYAEASSFDNGIGLVRLMGRESGYIAANATLAAGVVDCCLIPEVDFSLEGDDGLLALLERKCQEQSCAVVVVAEGAGQKYFPHIKEKDASGNNKLGNIGHFLQEKIVEHFTNIGKPCALKYIDPSYMIRACPANPADQLFCTRFAQNAVHAAMAGKTGMLIGYWHGRMTHIPFAALGNRRQKINPRGDLWFNVLESTNQPVIPLSKLRPSTPSMPQG